MRSLTHVFVAVAFAAPALALGQSPDVSKILADARHALGGDRLDEVRTLAIEGRSTSVRPGGTRTTEFEMAVQLPDKFMRREVVAAMGNMSVYRLSGFNGPDGLINEIDRPPQLGSGRGILIGTGPSNPAGSAADLTPEQREEQRQTALLAAKADYARLALGVFAAAPAVYPLEFSYGGEAESPDGTAHIVDVKGEGDFAARLFIDTRTHLPLMLSWMDKEPLQMMVAGGRGAGAGMQMRNPGAGGLSAAEREELMRDMQERLKEAEANRRTVEYRLFYGDYRAVDGVQVPHRLQYAIDGNPSRELTLDRVRLNQRIDQRKFRTSR